MQAFIATISSQHPGTGPAFSGSTREKEDGSAADSSDSAKISKDLMYLHPLSFDTCHPRKYENGIEIPFKSLTVDGMLI